MPMPSPKSAPTSISSRPPPPPLLYMSLSFPLCLSVGDNNDGDDEEDEEDEDEEGGKGGSPPRPVPPVFALFMSRPLGKYIYLLYGTIVLSNNIRSPNRYVLVLTGMY